MLTMSSCIAPRVVPLTCSLPIFTPMRRRSLMTASKCYKMDCDSADSQKACEEVPFEMQSM